ncbi:hypothetical protein Brsp07_04538 [Brucella sp. NBRC 14130]|uniref:hypothetical protein n=1 Tax=Brucella sp. NBRC 14130 TaxID=3075483 RepID=UPI0030A30CB1
MTYSIVPQKGKWQIVNTKTNKLYGDPFDRIEDAQQLVREAEAQAVIDRLTACSRAGCSV